MGLSPQEHFDLYFWLLLTRRTEERMRAEYRAQKPDAKIIPGNLYLATFQEAVPVGAAFAAKPTDWISHTHRDLGALLTNGRWDLKDIFANVLGRATGPAQGRDSGINFGSLEKRTMVKHVFMGINLPIACGVAKADVVLAFFGDGATSQGFPHEAMNQAGLKKRPIILFCNNNQYAISTPVEMQVAGGSIAKRAEGYGFPGISIDGTDILAVYEAAQEAIARARAGEGPTLIEAKTFRFSGHAEHDLDPQTGIPSYIPPERWQKEGQPENDPLVRYRQYLLENSLMTEEDFAAHEEDIAGEIESAWGEALAMPPPEPGDNKIFASAEVETKADQTANPSTRKGRYDRAITEALADAMRADPTVYLLGQDISYGGVFGVTPPKLQREFGPERVIDTPLSENLIIGEAIGSALLGQKPVAEIQFADFVSVGFAPLSQFAASHYYRSGIPLPMVVRLPYGIKGAGGPFHSQSMEGWFLNTPGLKMVFPATAEDAYGLLRTAIVDPNPVLFFEHKGLYQKREAMGPFNKFIPFGKAVLRREGKDCLLATYGAAVWWAMEAAETLAKEGIECAVLDLRTLVPLDEDQMTQLAKEIGRVVIIHEAPKQWGAGGHLAQVIREADQKVAVRVIGAKYTPIPSSPILEKAYLPSTSEIVEVVRRMVRD